MRAHAAVFGDSLPGYATVTGRDGRYRFDSLPSGDYVFEIDDGNGNAAMAEFRKDLERGAQARRTDTLHTVGRLSGTLGQADSIPDTALVQVFGLGRKGVRADALGRFSFVSVRPAGYPVPIDGPCGELLAAQGRKVMRPAHLHFIAAAEGYRVLATQFFDIEDPNAFEDVVFGAVGSLLRRFEPDGEGGYRLDVELRLEPGETRLPHCPLP